MYFLLEKIGLILAGLSYTHGPVENTLFYEGFLIYRRGRGHFYRASRASPCRNRPVMRTSVVTGEGDSTTEPLRRGERKTGRRVAGKNGAKFSGSRCLRGGPASEVP